MIKYIVILLSVLFMFAPPCLANDDCRGDECEAWTQEMFTELMTFVYEDGEAIVTGYGNTLYNVSLERPEENGVRLIGHLGLFVFDDFVVLTVEGITTDENDNIVIDHNFYTSYFDPEIAQYYYLPHFITGNIIVKTKENAIISMTPKMSREFKSDGYENEEWLWWMGLFYEYMQTQKAKGKFL